MSIPLDRLYTFLNNVSNHALLIYGWQTHGSKKLRDLQPWIEFPKDWQVRKTQPALIFHDQEPLDYDFSQQCVNQEFCDAVGDWKNFSWWTQPNMQRVCKNMHFRSVVEQTLYDQILLVHSEKNSSQVEKYQQNNFATVYYWSHALISRDWFRFAQHDPKLKVKSPDSKLFLVYNRAWAGTREYRLKFAEQLIAENLQGYCNIGFSKFDNQVCYRDHVFSNPDFEISHTWLEKILPVNNHDSAASADYNSNDYQHSLIEVVLETLFDDSRHHLTEKALRPIACGQPFILAATAGSLAYLREYGFKTFHGHIDETYDTIQDPKDRLAAIVQEMKRISSLSESARQQLVNGVQAATEHNQKLFFSDQFHHQVISEFQQNLDQAVADVKNGPVGGCWTQVKSAAHEHDPETFLDFLEIDQHGVDWINTWIAENSKL
jgi:hypothetical protein